MFMRPGKSPMPPAINFSNGDLSNWTAFTGNLCVERVAKDYKGDTVSKKGTVTLIR